MGEATYHAGWLMRGARRDGVEGAVNNLGAKGTHALVAVLPQLVQLNTLTLACTTSASYQGPRMGRLLRGGAKPGMGWFEQTTTSAPMRRVRWRRCSLR